MRSPDARTNPSLEGRGNGEGPSRRVLFLDDDPLRAQIFMVDCPEAVWVQTAADCIAKLAERWDEVHLDHDLGGEHFVDHDREDCGMEVVRWICLAPRPHLKTTRFLVHSHNIQAAAMMGLNMLANGFKVDVRPFGTVPADAPAETLGDEPDPIIGPLKSCWRAAMRLLGLRPKYDYGYDERRGGASAEEATRPLDLSWAKSNAFHRPKSPGDEPEGPLDLSRRAEGPPRPDPSHGNAPDQAAPEPPA